MSHKFIQLIDPSPVYERTFWDFCDQFADIKQIDGLGMMRHAKDIGFTEAVTQSLMCRKDDYASADWVSQSTYWLINSENQMLGTIDLRHQLKGILETWGGHVGYAIHPDHRRKGYATYMLKQLLPVAKEMNISRLLVTCYEGNASSSGVIKNCGGIFESTINHPNEDVSVDRYWIRL